jgi:hypothetical protein
LGSCREVMQGRFARRATTRAFEVFIDSFPIYPLLRKERCAFALVHRPQLFFQGPYLLTVTFRWIEAGQASCTGAVGIEIGACSQAQRAASQKKGWGQPLDVLTRDAPINARNHDFKRQIVCLSRCVLPNFYPISHQIFPDRARKWICIKPSHLQGCEYCVDLGVIHIFPAGEKTTVQACAIVCVVVNQDEISCAQHCVGQDVCQSIPNGARSNK